MMNSSREIVKEMSSGRDDPRHDERQRDEPEGGPLRLAKVVGRFLERGVEVREGRVQDRDAEGRADQRMRRDHRPLRQRKPEDLHDHHEKRHRDDDLGQHQRQHDEPHDPGLARKTVARRGTRREEAERGRQNGRGHRDDERVPERVTERRDGREFREPLRREAVEREGDDRGVVEREERQEDDRGVEKDQVSDRIDPEPSALHRPALSQRRVRRRKTIEIAPTITMATMAVAAPIGALFWPRNSVWIQFEIIRPDGPPTSCGVT